MAASRDIPEGEKVNLLTIQSPSLTDDSYESPCKHYLFRLADVSIACFLIAPVLICFWASTWLLMDTYVFPFHHLTSATVCAVLGSSFSLYTIAIQGEIIRWLSTYDKFIGIIVWKLHIYFIALSCISFWRGFWLLLDYGTTVTVTSYIFSHLIAVVVLTVMRTATSAVSTPGFFVSDMVVAIPLINTVEFTQNVDNSFGKNLLNSFITVSVVGVAVVAYWRGTWKLCDIVISLHVAHSINGSLVTFSAAIVVCIVCFMICDPIEDKLTKKSPNWMIFALEHLFVYVVALTSVNIWRGLWSLWTIFIHQDIIEKNVAALITHYATLILLYIGQAASNLVGVPVGCRTHSPDSLEGFYMGTYLGLAKPRTFVSKGITDQE